MNRLQVWVCLCVCLHRGGKGSKGHVSEAEEGSKKRVCVCACACACACACGSLWKQVVELVSDYGPGERCPEDRRKSCWEPPMGCLGWDRSGRPWGGASLLLLGTWLALEMLLLGTLGDSSVGCIWGSIITAFLAPALPCECIWGNRAKCQVTSASLAH